MYLDIIVSHALLLTQNYGLHLAELDLLIKFLCANGCNDYVTIEFPQMMKQGLSYITKHFEGIEAGFEWAQHH